MAKLSAELRAIAQDLRYRSSQGSYSRAARKGQQVRRLERMAERLERINRPKPEPFEPPF